MSEKGFNIFDDMEDIVVNENDDQVLESKERTYRSSRGRRVSGCKRRFS